MGVLPAPPDVKLELWSKPPPPPEPPAVTGTPAGFPYLPPAPPPADVIVPKVESLPELPVFEGVVGPDPPAPPAPTVTAYVPKLNSCADPCKGEGPYPDAR